MQPPKESYKEKNGTTRVGDALRWMAKQGKEIAPELLDIASSVTNVGALEVLADKIRGAKSLTDFDKEMLLKNLEQDKEEMLNVSNRWKYDMASDSWLSKNIRPISLAFLTFITFIFVMLESSIKGFTVDPSWVKLMENLLLTVYVAYFGSRGVEKFKKIQRS